jgi:ribosomal-protein-alanine N-acetyltransferase
MTEIRTARLLLRPFKYSDVDDSLSYRNDREFARFLPHIPQPFTRLDAEKFVETNITEPWEMLPTFAVVFDDHVIGTVNFEIDTVKKIAMLGYAIARSHWGKGIATEATSAGISWAISEHKLVQIYASTDPLNVRSQRVLEKLGMKRDLSIIDRRLYRLDCTQDTPDAPNTK